MPEPQAKPEARTGQEGAVGCPQRPGGTGVSGAVRLGAPAEEASAALPQEQVTAPAATRQDVR